ncbi:hypothetical protein [Eshraghiella crossota]|jgi:ribosomal protein L21E|uniref:hypothetical protein n=1 Tax=Eshraghiella crossota TaxID=45851 RepID=UPI003AB39C55
MKSKMNVLGRVLSMILAVALTVTTVFSGFSRKTLAAENNVITVEEGEKDSVTFDWSKWKVESNSNPRVAKASIHTNIIGEKKLVVEGLKRGSTTVVVNNGKKTKTYVVNVSRAKGIKANHLYVPVNNQFELYDNGKLVGTVKTDKKSFDMDKITVTAAYGDGEKVNIKINSRKLMKGSDAILYGNDFYTGSKNDPIYYTMSYPVTFTVNGKSVTVIFTDKMTFYNKENSCYYVLDDGGIAFKLENKQNVTRHTVKFVNGTEVIETISVIDGQSAKYNGVTPVKAETEYASYTFNGWVDVNDNVADLTNVKSDKTVYASFTEEVKQYTVKFLYENGEVLSEHNYSYNDIITVPDVPEKADDVEFEYTSAAWSPEVSTVCKGNAEYKATYEAEKKQYKVIYSVNGKETEKIFDALTSAEDVRSGAPEVASDYEIDGKRYEFKGWDKAFEKVTKDVVYTALYDVTDIQYTVKFVNSNGEVISEQNLKYGDKIVKPGNPKYPGNKDIYEHMFAGWDKEVSDVCTGDATYKAVFDKSIKIAFYKYNIEASSRKDLFDYEYITGREPKYFTKLGSTITVTNDFTGYENIISMLEEAYIKGESDTIYGNNNEEFVKSFVSLTAEKAGVKEDAVDCWYVLKREADGWHVDGGNLKDYTVKFVDYDDSIISERIYNANENIIIPSNPVRESDETYNYKFAGWDKEVTSVKGNVDYKAVYEPSYIDYTVRFLNEDGSVITEATYHYGEDVVVPADPAKAADETYTYTFAGWDKEVTSVKGNTDYTAVYTDEYNKYIVRFLDEDGTVILKSTYHYGEDVVIPANPAKAADETYTYTFAGWDKEVTSVKGNTDYKAVYESSYIDYTVRFLNEDGSVITEATYHYGDDVAVPADPAKEADETYNYKFAGWDKEVTSVKGNVDYTATYTERLNRIPEVEGDEDIVPEINPGNKATDDNKPSVRPVRKPEVEADEDVATGDGNMTLYIAILGLSAATLAVIMGRKKEQDI